jgi:hypothetical protein
MRAIHYLVLHHTATTGLGDGSAEWAQIMATCQTKRGPTYRCDYHYGIGPTGVRFEGQWESLVAYHSGDDPINNHSLGIACIGNLERNDIPAPQQRTLLKTLLELRLRFPGVKLMLHREIVATLCPGKYFPEQEVKLYFTKGSRFSDVSPEHLFCQAIEAVVAKGLMNGDQEGTFRPNDPVLRGELAQVLWNWMSLGEK